MCKFGLKSVGAPGLRFPVERRSLYSSFPFRRKTGGLPLCEFLAASVWSGFVAVALAAVSFGPCARPESPPKGGGHLWWLSDRAYCAAFLHRPLGINRPYTQVLLSPALRLITRWFVSPLFAPR